MENEKSEKPEGVVLPPKILKKQNWDFLRHDIETNDLNLPITSNVKTTRVEIFDQLWIQFSDVFAKSFLTDAEYSTPENLCWVIVELKIKALTEVLAYAFSLKKPAGLATFSKKSTNDSTLATLKTAFRKSEEIQPIDELYLFYPSFKQELLQITTMQKQLLAKYELLTEREDLLIKNVVLSFEELRTTYNKTNFSDEEIKNLIKESFTTTHNAERIIYYGIEDLVRFIPERIDSYEYFENGQIKRVRQEQKNLKELRILDDSGNDMQKRYPDK